MTQSSATTPEDKLDFKRIFPIFIIVLVDLLGLTIIIPLLPIYAASYGADPLTIGLLGAAFPAMQLLAGPLLGSLSDRFGRKPVLLFSQIGTFLGFILLGVANSIPLLFLSRLIDGASGANIVAAQAAISDVTTERTRAQGLGLLGAAFGLGFTLGPALAGIALGISQNNYHVPAFLAAGFSLISLLLTAIWFKETLPAEKRHEHKATGSLNPVSNLIRALANPLISLLLALMFLQQMIFGGYENLFSLFSLNRLGLNAAGNAVIFVFIGVILIFVQGKYIGPLSRRYGERKLIYAGLGLLAAGLILTALTPAQAVPWYDRASLVSELSRNTSEKGIAVALPSGDSMGWVGLAWIMIASIPAAIGGGLLSPSINSLITKRVGRTQSGSALGASAALVSTANAITPLVGGALFQFAGSTAPFLVGGVLMGVLMVFALTWIKPRPEDSVASAAPIASH